MPPPTTTTVLSLCVIRVIEGETASNMVIAASTPCDSPFLAALHWETQYHQKPLISISGVHAAIRNERISNKYFDIIRVCARARAPHTRPSAIAISGIIASLFHPVRIPSRSSCDKLRLIIFIVASDCVKPVPVAMSALPMRAIVAYESVCHPNRCNNSNSMWGLAPQQQSPCKFLTRCSYYIYIAFEWICKTLSLVFRLLAKQHSRISPFNFTNSNRDGDKPTTNVKCNLNLYMNTWTKYGNVPSWPTSRHPATEPPSQRSAISHVCGAIKGEKHKFISELNFMDMIYAMKLNGLKLPKPTFKSYDSYFRYAIGEHHMSTAYTLRDQRAWISSLDF